MPPLSFGYAEYFDLQWRSGGTWSTFSEGYSAVVTNKGEESWSFGAK